MVELPLEWDYVDQISHKGRSLDGAYVVRDHFSSKDEKREHCRTVQEFRDQHAMEFTKEKMYFITLAEDWSHFPKETVCAGGSVSIMGDRSLSIVLNEKERKKYNVYLFLKSLRNIEKFSHPGADIPTIAQWKALYFSEPS